MITSIIAGLALKTGLAPKSVRCLLAIAGVLIAIALAMLAWNLWLSSHDEGVIDRHEAKVETQLQKQGRAADQNMMERKEASQAKAAEERKEFDNATAHLPKSGLTARQRIDACEQLKKQGQEPEICRRLP